MPRSTLQTILPQTVKASKGLTYLCEGQVRAGRGGGGAGGPNVFTEIKREKGVFGQVKQRAGGGGLGP